MEVFITNKTKNKIKKQEIKKKLENFLKKHNVQENSEISVIIVDRHEMLVFVEKYLKETGDEAAAHPVLSFVQNELEGPFVNPPDGVVHLGEIVVSIDHSKTEEELYALIEHGALHLLGIHHS